MNERQSLYDYLGRAAGPELGWSVAKYAGKVNAVVTLREVHTTYYNGTINVYDKAFLDTYFTDPQHAQILAQDKEWYNKRRKK